jgi:cation:H+ antiporter
MLIDLLIFAVSLSVLLVSSNGFIDSAEKIGLSFGISPFIIGVTIVAFGTSLPELATSIAAVSEGTSEVVVGNVIGSNITNILLVLGLTAIVGRRIILEYDVMNIDMPLLVGSAFLMFFTLQDLHLSMIEVIIYLVALVGFLLNSFRYKGEEILDKPKAKIRDYIILAIGGVGVYLSAKYTIVGITGISLKMGISPDIISLSLLAFGTSLPEVVVSIAAARKGKHAIAVGNVLGSNIFNTYAVMGIPSLLGTLTIPESILEFSLPFMLAVTIIFALICFTRRISQWEGLMLFLFYVYFIYELSRQI